MFLVVINGGTLIVCPASLISQWENEVRTKLKPSLLKIGQYYGINRNMTAKELAKYDLVTTSYHIIMWEYKKHEKSVSAIIFNNENYFVII